jgi:hypothetical protein
MVLSFFLAVLKLWLLIHEDHSVRKSALLSYIDMQPSIIGEQINLNQRSKEISYSNQKT